MRRQRRYCGRGPSTALRDIESLDERPPIGQPLVGCPEWWAVKATPFTMPSSAADRDALLAAEIADPSLFLLPFSS
jgi:hypothetical protein